MVSQITAIYCYRIKGFQNLQGSLESTEHIPLSEENETYRAKVPQVRRGRCSSTKCQTLTQWSHHMMSHLPLKACSRLTFLFNHQKKSKVIMAPRVRAYTLGFKCLAHESINKVLPQGFSLKSGRYANLPPNTHFALKIQHSNSLCIFKLKI